MFDKIKQLTKDTAIYGISTMLGRFLNFLLVPLYTNIFLPAEYGIIANIYALVAILNILFIYGMDSSYLKFAKSDEFKNPKINFTTPFVSIFVTGIIFSLFLFLFQNEIASLLSIPEKYEYFLTIVIGILFLDALCVLPFIYLRLERKAKLFTAIKLINIFANISVNVILIFVFKEGIESVVISNLIASVITLLILASIIIRNIEFQFDYALFKRLLKFGLPYLPAGIAAMLIQVVNRPIIESLTNIETLGIFQANYKLGIFMMLFVSMFQYAWQPFFMQNSKETNAKEIFSKIFTLFTIVGSVILVALSLFIEDFVKINFFGFHLIGEAYWGGLNIVPIILFSYLFNGLYINFTAGLYITEKSSSVPMITFIGVAVNIAANYLLIPALSLVGAAIASLLSYVTMAVGYFYVAQKHYPIQYETKKIFKIFLSIFLVGGAFYYLDSIGYLTIYYKAILFFSFLFLLFFLKVITKNEINFIKEKFIRRYFKR